MSGYEIDLLHCGGKFSRFSRSVELTSTYILAIIAYELSTLSITSFLT